MAVYTHLSDKQISDFLQNYQLGKLKSAKGIAQGVENTNYMLEIDHGKREESKAILTVFEKRVKQEDLPFYINFMAHLSAKGINCPLPYQQKNGQMIGELAGKPAVLISFLNGAGVDAIEVFHLAELGAEIGLMHQVVQDFAESRGNDLAPNKLGYLYAKVAGKLDELQQGLSEAIGAEIENMKRWDALEIPRGVIHADLFPDNVFFEDKSLTGVIDFYFACSDWLAYELAICMNAWCFEADHSINQHKVDALLKSYQTHRKLSDKEKELLPFLARGAALRFMLTRAHDWFYRVEGAMVQPKDPREYLHKWKYWKNL